MSYYAPKPYVELTVELKRVSGDRGDAMVRRAVVFRSRPDGRHRVEVRADEDPQAEYEKDAEAHRLAERAGMCAETGYAIWSSDGPVWVQSFAEGERWTPIPRPTEP
jgi:hypothetical protein